MRYEIEIRSKATKDLAAIPKLDAKRISERILGMEHDLAGDIKRLTNFTPEYRLRVGNWRVLFDVDASRITIYRIVNRKDAYK